jgi:hypothetical protein
MTDTILKPVSALAARDEVFWDDPDEGLCSRSIQIQSIEFHGDMVRITDVSGDELECYASELSQ